MAIHSIFRNVRHFTAFSVKTLIHSRPNHSSYQQFDVPHHRRNPSPQITSNKLSMHKILRKWLGQFAQPAKLYSSSSSAPNIPKCWNCAEEQRAYSVLQMFCHKCGLVRDTGDGTTADYFHLLGQPRQFDIDTNALTMNFRQLQSVIHPDKFSNTSEKEQQFSADWSSLINKAYKTLLTPIKRGEYILRLNGIEIPEGNTSVGNAFLLEMMERNEEVDDAQSADALNELLHKVHDDLRRVVATLDKALSANSLEVALQDVITLRYLISLETSIKNKKTRLGILS